MEKPRNRKTGFVRRGEKER